MSVCLVARKENCCGCGTCAMVCPVHAITMQPQELGCVYPVIDTKKCIECNLCQRNCAYQKQNSAEWNNQTALAAMTTDRELLKKSASGGVFATIARSVIDAGGIVFGASMEFENGVVVTKHIGIDCISKLSKLQGSKYVQSDLGNSFLHIKKYLCQGRTVLFSGTPCQVDSLRNYLQSEDTRNLYTIDLICHGVPSARFFQDYIACLGNKEISEFYFRDKTLGWGLNARYVLKRNGRHIQKLLPPGVSSYYTYFLSSEIYRESCYSCKYANLKRVGDITIGDFWGFEKEHPEYLAYNGGEFGMNDGISTVLINSPKGKDLVERYGNTLRLAESSREKVARWNRQLSGPSIPSGKRKEIAQQYEKNGYKGVERLYRKQLGIRYVVRKVKACVLSAKMIKVN